ncbi:OsmC family protein [Aurantimonas sp. VKM B-3413]|uniref:OsmC family protein n=1 Tax=Aurantimonas sp. VKM B-3413 TaxID=2779401 RepID=UPI001E35C957|nr:OsmC family protein [Aurantimonas sp. VKM B-3413]MCB8838395.1 OsmC family protein [Aurantimonas sp. VKM B-3413]
MERLHRYRVRVRWTGNTGSGTSGYKDYARSHAIEAPGKPAIAASADPHFRGDPASWNPEELLVASLSACHQLWYLHLCAVAGVVVTGYEDDAEGEMAEEGGGAGRFRRVVLKPRVRIAPGSDIAAAESLHANAHEMCFVANSVNFPVELSAEVMVDG